MYVYTVCVYIYIYIYVIIHTHCKQYKYTIVSSPLVCSYHMSLFVSTQLHTVVHINLY